MIRKALRSSFRSFISNVPFKGRGVLIDALDPFLRARETQTVDTVFGVPYTFDYTLDAKNVVRQYYRIYEPDEVWFAQHVLKPGQTVLDVGANLGYMTAVFAAAVGSEGRVVSAEPVPTIYQVLSDRVKGMRSAGYNVKTVQLAIGDTEGETTIRTANDGNIGWASIVPGMINEETRLKDHVVRQTTASTVIAEEKLEGLDFIKIDVEGYESAVLKGLLPYLKKATHKPVIMCEIADEKVQEKMNTSTSAMLDMMDGAGYEPFILSHKSIKPLPAGFLGKDRFYTCNLVWLPKK